MSFSAPTQIGSVVNVDSSTATSTITVGAGGVPAGALVVIHATKSVSVASITAADTKSNTYSVAVTNSEPVDNQTISQIYSILATALVSGDVITLTYGATFSEKIGAADYYTASGAITYGSSSSADSTFPHANKPAGTLTAAAGNLAVTGYVTNIGPDTWTQGAGWTSGRSVNGTGSISAHFMQYQLSTSAGSLSPTATSTASSSTAGVSSLFVESAAVPPNDARGGLAPAGMFDPDLASGGWF